jgi:alkyl sulfatase BDS1-like metallo-beta-lactamase superfamily hydrolase
MTMPPALEAAWNTHGYYGSVSHNTKAIYQRYMGWYDGNPAHLWEHTPEERASRYVAALGGGDAVVAQARTAYEAGDLRWAAELLNHAIFADEGNAAAKTLQADVLEQLGYLSENGTWRSAYLAGAMELRHGGFGTPVSATSLDVLMALSPEQIFDAIAIRVNGPKAWSEHLVIGVALTDTGESYRLELRNGVLVQVAAPVDGADLVLRLPRPRLIGLLPGQMEGVALEGDQTALGRLLAVLDAPDPDFAIVTP